MAGMRGSGRLPTPGRVCVCVWGGVEHAADNFQLGWFYSVQQGSTKQTDKTKDTNLMTHTPLTTDSSTHTHTKRELASGLDCHNQIMVVWKLDASYLAMILLAT